MKPTSHGDEAGDVQLVAAAYFFLWVVVLGYVWLLHRKQRALVVQLDKLEALVTQTSSQPDKRDSKQPEQT